MAVKLLCICNPILDVTATVTEECLKAYDLQPNNAILADPSKHGNMVAELCAQYSVSYSAGGAGLNTARAAAHQLAALSDTCPSIGYLSNDCSSVHLDSNALSHAVAFIGCIGDDEHGRMIEQIVSADGVKTAFQVDNNHHTGTCSVLLTGKNRSLVADLAAANCLRLDHLEQPHVMQLIDEAVCYYSSGYVLTVCPEAMLLMAHSARNSQKQVSMNDSLSKESQFNSHCARTEASSNETSSDHPYAWQAFTGRQKLFAMNLSAPFLCHFFRTQMLSVLPLADIIFCNEDELVEFCKANQLLDGDAETNRNAMIPELMHKMQSMLACTRNEQLQADSSELAYSACDSSDSSIQSTSSDACDSMLVVTRSHQPTLLLDWTGKMSEHAVELIEDADAIVDTNGAGDVFAGAFLANLLVKKITNRRGINGSMGCCAQDDAAVVDWDDCVQAGHAMARKIIQTSGIVF